MEKITLTRAIHDLKSSFHLRFGKDEIITPELEKLINAAAVRVKKGDIAEWYRDDTIKIKFSRYRRSPSKPPANQNGGYKSNATGRKNN